MFHKSRRLAGTLAVLGLGVGMLGTGVFASFTDGGTATQSVSVGTMHIQLANNSGGTLSNNNQTLTGSSGTLVSSAASTPASLFNFDIKNTGTIAATVTVTSGVTGDPSFSDALSLGSTGVQYVVAGGTSKTITGAGFKWGVLGNGDEGLSATLTYTISASA
jgi:predicted ribosomally synthesized peptide with SipW-like signal peptide